VHRFLQTRCETVGGGLRNRHTGRRVKAILPVHILGHPVDLDPILELARRYDLRVVEDATESLGSRYRGRAVGCLGDIGCFSFNGNKIITTGGGGMLVTGDKGLADRARYLTTQAKDDPLESVHGAVGYNYRLTNVQAAIGCAQLERLDEYVRAKRRIAETYSTAFAGVPGVTLMRQAPWAESNCWMYTVLFDSQRAADSRAVMRSLSACGIQARPLWQPVHRSPAHADLPIASCPVADRLNAEALSLPCSVGLTSEVQQRVIAAVKAAVSADAEA
jgi:perosamine synthetase